MTSTDWPICVTSFQFLITRGSKLLPMVHKYQKRQIAPYLVNKTFFPQTMAQYWSKKLHYSNKTGQLFYEFPKCRVNHLYGINNRLVYISKYSCPKICRAILRDSLFWPIQINKWGKCCFCNQSTSDARLARQKCLQALML